MAEQVVGTVEAVKKETRTGEYGEYTLQNFKVKHDNQETWFNNIVKKNLEEVEKGDMVTVNFETITHSKGTSPRPISIKKGTEEVTKAETVMPQEENKTATRWTKKVDVDNVKVTTPQVANPPWENKPTSKDVSMEVSGLLQALINTQSYTGETLRSKQLEEDLKTVLIIKRRVAKDYE